MLVVSTSPVSRRRRLTPARTAVIAIFVAAIGAYCGLFWSTCGDVFSGAVFSDAAFAGDAALAAAAEPSSLGEPVKGAGRKPSSDDDLRYWLENAIWLHRFSNEEAAAALDLSPAEVAAAMARFDIRRDGAPDRPADAPLLVAPYPGGRHPRIGFLDGAIKPQRETKVSVFLPWADGGYVVADVPEAIWSNLGLTYLAHTHIDTIWTKQRLELPPLEWDREKDGTFEIERRLPNGIEFGCRVEPRRESVRMELWLKNGSSDALSDLRVQNCLMLKAAPGFAEQTNDNKVFRQPYTAVRSQTGDRWIIWAWTPCHRAWGNAPCPCLHSDPKFPDCPPGETRRLRGWLSFYEGDDLEAELKRIEATEWAAEK